MVSSSIMTALPVVSSEVNGEENTAVVNTTTGGSESLLTDVGVKFRPSDSVLARDYLTKKVSGCTDGPIFPLIKQVNVYKYEPWWLSSLAHDFGDGIMYFFTPVEKKFGKGANFNRLAGVGFWKKTGNSSDIKGEDGTTIATKTPLTYYKNGQKPGELPKKTQWLMKEFILEKQSDAKSKTQLALCVVYLHNRKRKPCESNQNELGDDVLVEGSPEIFAENLVMPSAENPNFRMKRHCSSFDLDEIFSDQIPMSNNQNQGKASCSNTQSEISTNPSIALASLLAENIPFVKCDPNFLNTMTESQGAADPNVHIASYQSPLPDFRNCHPTQDSGESLEQFNSGSNLSATSESQGAADPNVHIPGYQSPLPDFRNCFPTQDSVESLEQFNSGSNPSATFESLLAGNIPFPNYEQNFSNTLMESQVAVDPNVHIPNYRTPPLDFGNGLPNSDDSIDELIKELLAN